MPIINTDSDPWSLWTSSTSGSITTTSDIFSLWADTTSTGTVSTASTAIIWAAWCEDDPILVASLKASYERINQLAPPPESTPEQQRAERARIVRVEAESKKRIQKAKENKERALTLLRDTLDAKQRKDFDKHGYFYVTSPSGNLYRIKTGRMGNVEQVFKNRLDKRIARLCAHPARYIPDYDTMLVQKIMLEHREDAFRRVANISVH